ncbi:protelomerase family protein [Calothrix sp. FACHB-168]|uniref:protelomerase family protein n=1 Tax=Calothrix sp. FACHB-168 TaxID=2692780 RepID=UPI0016866B06|nr:protelomerase family protein [Calothrix sp. FACHB-168]MBD2208127.1 hypothetical protein [Calothrix sp. FACHB-168]
MAQKLKSVDDLENTYIDRRVKFLLPQFEKLAPFKQNERKKGVSVFDDETGENINVPGWEDLAIHEAQSLRFTYPDNSPEEERQYNTALSQIPRLIKALKVAAKTDLKDHANINGTNTIINNFHNTLKLLFAENRLLKNKIYREGVEERSQPENRVEIDLTNSLNLAYSLLSDLKNVTTNDWPDISCAIALVTGRRMAEIHLSASFEYYNDYEVIFRGQLKGKARKVKADGRLVSLREKPFKIPTLIHAKLVCDGLAWLEKNDKRFAPNEDPERVNRRFSKQLSKATKSWDFISDESERTYHKFRAAYFRASVVNSKVDPYDFVRFGEQVLGDGDDNTISAYKRYEIKAGTITRI